VYKGFHRILGALTVLLLGVFPAVNPFSPDLPGALAAACSPTESSYSSSGSTYNVLSFTAAGTCQWTVPSGVSTVEYLIVAGGGSGGDAGGNEGGGGGGAGGVATNVGSTPLSITPASSQSIVVGAGGQNNNNGENSSAFGEAVSGGGRGGYSVGDESTYVGGDGGSGGGGHGWGDPRDGGSGVPGEGNDGGQGPHLSGGGGGGGAAGDGSNGSDDEGGAGGDGLSSSITGSSVTYAEGGDGGGEENGDSPSSYGSGGGGAKFDKVAPTEQRYGTPGRDGVVILRYSLAPEAPTGTSVASGDGEMTLSYTAPTHWGGGTLSLEYTTDGGSNWRDLGETDGVTTVSLESDGTALQNNTLYTVKLRAKNDLGSGYTSSEVTVGDVIPAAVGEVLRFDATNPDSFDPDSDTDWSDISGSRTGTLEGDASFDARSKAFEFDGTGDYIDVGDITTDFSNGLAIHAVVDFGDAQDYERVFEFTDSDGTAGNIAFGRFGTQNTLYLEVYQGSTASNCYSRNDAIRDGFHAYSVILSSSGACTFQRDGETLTANQDSTALIPDNVVRDTNYLGVARGAASQFLEGSIQSLVLYNTDQTTPICYPIEDTFTGNGTIGESDVPYKTLQFNTAGDCTWTVPDGVELVDALVVAGGGGGGGGQGHNDFGGNAARGGGGGGGAGGLRTASATAVTAGGSVAVSVGVGGAGTPTGVAKGANNSQTLAQNGGDSGFGALAASGGGGGGDAVKMGATGRNGADGGSGGGGAGDMQGITGYDTAGGSGNSGSYDPSEGNDGAGQVGGQIASGGGGGAGSAGAANQTGGSGATSSLTGSVVTYAAGGGGGFGKGSTGSIGTPGDSSAGAGGDRDTAPGFGLANSGSGGGGAGGELGENAANPYAGGDGGSGIVVVRYSLGPSSPAISSVSSGDGSIDVTFTAPSHTGGAAITDYEYSFDGSAWTSLGTDSAGTETISGLTNGTAYTVRLRAVNDNGNGESVTAGSATTPRGSQTLTWNPTNTSVEVKDGSVTLAPAASALGGVTIEYSVQTPGDPTCAIADDSTPTVTYSAEGTCVIRATAVEGGAYLSATTDVTLTVSKSSQTITFASISDKTYGDSAFALTVSSNSGLTVTVTPADTSVCTVASTTVTIVSVGTCSLTASQAGDSEYDAATDVTRSLTIAAKPITMSVAISDKTYDGLSAASVSGTPSLTGVEVGDTSDVAVDTAEISAEFADPDAGSGKSVAVTLGDDVLTGDRSDRYTVTVSSSPTATISKASQSSMSITSANSMVYGQSIPIVAVGGSSSGDVSYAKVSGPCTVTGSTVTSTGAGSCVVTATREADTNYNSVTSSNFTITVSKANQSINFTSTVPVSAVSGTTYTPAATATSGLAVDFDIAAPGKDSVCSISSGVVTFLTSGTCVITAAQSGDTDYNAASSVTQTIVAGKINQTITFPAIAGKDFDDPAFGAGATVSSGRTVTYATSTSSVCAVNASTGVVSIKTIGDCTVTASSTGDASYAAASDVTRTFTISPVLAGKPSVTSVSFGDSSVTVAFVAPGFVGGDAIDGYQVVATSSGGVVTKPDCSTTSPCTITGLTNGESYTLTVAAINAAGVGSASDASPSIIPARVADAVSGLATTPGDEELAVSWTALTNDQVTAAGGTFTRYDVYLRVNGGSWGSAVTPDGTNNLATRTTTSYTFTGLTNGTAYDVKVVAITNANSTELSSNTSTALGVPATVPAAVSGLTATALSNTTAVASWSAPVDDGGSVVTAYSVNLSCTFVNATDTFCELSGLTAGSTVTVSVGATNLMGTGSTVSVSVTMPGGSSGGSSGGGETVTSSPAAATDAPVVVPRRVIVPVQPTPVPRLLAAPVRIIPERGFDPDAGAKARIGGQPATVTKKPLGEGGLSVEVGAFQLGIKLSTPGSSAPSDAGQRSDIDVPTGQSTKVSGGGLLPGSSLQVWLPGVTGESPRELARIPVQSDGSFASELSFTSRQSETPIPIGRQVMQVTGYDEQGNQTIVDMVVNIGQGAPAPEPNRSVNELPELSPGQSLATSAGVPETVTIEARPDDREVAVMSGAWAFSVALPDDAGEIEQVESGATITMVQTKTASVSGEGFQPDTRVDIWLFSDPTLLGSVIVSADGSFTGEVYVDARYATPGEHTLQLQGVADDGFIKAANLGVVVQEPVEFTTENASGLLWWVIGAFLLAVVLIVVLLARSRRNA